MPESLPTAVAVLRDQMQSLIDEQLRPLEEQLSDDPTAAVPAEIAQAAREHSRQAGMWAMTQPADFGGVEAGTLALLEGRCGGSLSTGLAVGCCLSTGCIEVSLGLRLGVLLLTPRTILLSLRLGGTLLGLDAFPLNSTVVIDQSHTVVTAETLGGQLEARLTGEPLRPVQISMTFPDQPRVVAIHRWTTGEVRIEGAHTQRRLARVVDVHDDTTTVKIRTSVAQALTPAEMNDRSTVFDMDKIKSHLKPEVVE